MKANLRWDLDGVLRVQLTEDPEGPVLALDELTQGPRWSISIIGSSGSDLALHDVDSLPEALRLFANRLEVAAIA